MESNWRFNVVRYAGPYVTQRLIARILSGAHAGRLLCNINGTHLAIVPYPPFPGILPSPVYFRALAPGERFPYGYDVEPD